MKKLTIQEKAERFDKAYEIAEGIHRFSSNIAEIKRMEQLFPELKEESEDERIRGAIIDHLKDNNLTEWAVWLEKQGEQKPFDYENANIQKKDFAPKVGQKFKIGDWVVYMGTTAKILDLQKHCYVGIDTNGKDFVVSYINECEMKKWAIQEAKDGDVLVTNSGRPFIYKGCLDPNNPYCGIDTEGHLFAGADKSNCWWTDEEVHPATKEQREQLEKAMADAGFTFDFEGIELKKIEKNHSWSEEDEPQKELAETYLTVFDKKFPILPTLRGKQLADYKNFLNKCQQIFGLKYWGIHPTQAKLFEKLTLLWATWGVEHLQGLGQNDGDMDNEVKEVDYERELSKYVSNGIHRFFPNVDDDYCKIDSVTWQYYVIETARHFFELGMQVSNKAQKGEEL